MSKDSPRFLNRSLGFFFFFTLRCDSVSNNNNRGAIMILQSILKRFKLETFSGIVTNISTMTYYSNPCRDEEVVALELLITSDTDPNKQMIYSMGPLEFMGCIKDNRLATGDFISVRKYPLQTLFSIRRHVNRDRPSQNDRDAVRYMLSAGVKVLAKQATERSARYGEDDLTVKELRQHSFRALLIRQQLGNPQ